MTADLHQRLHDAITERLEIARAAANVDPRVVRIGLTYRAGDAIQAEAVRTFHDDDPAAFTIRACERDLAVLERHRAVLAWDDGPIVCSLEWGDGDGWVASWPCMEITSLATLYALEETT